MQMARAFSARRIVARWCLLALGAALSVGCLAPVAVAPRDEIDRQSAGAVEAVPGRRVESEAREPAEPRESHQEDDGIAIVQRRLQREMERLGLGHWDPTSEPVRPFLARPTPVEVREYIVERRAALAEAARMSPAVTTAARVYVARGTPSSELGALLDGQGVLAKNLRGGVWTDGTISGGMVGGSDTGGHLAELGIETVTEALSLATSTARESTQRRLDDLEKPDSPVRRWSARRHAQLVGEAKVLLGVLDDVGIPVHCIIVAHMSHAALARVDADPRVFLVDMVVGSRAGHWDVKEPPAAK